jgi:hypothetical protein
VCAGTRTAAAARLLRASTCRAMVARCALRRADACKRKRHWCAQTWHVATLDPLPAGAQARSTFAWRRWHVDLPTGADAHSAEIVCKAVDEKYVCCL